MKSFKKDNHIAVKGKGILFLFLLMLILAGCSKQANIFRMEGEFRNMNQAEFYLYDAGKGKKDTIHVQRGRFVYETVQEDTATLIMIFPNYSTMPIFAHSGITVKMKGDASHLKETKITGSKENEEMTAFRLKANQLTPPDVKKIAATYITEEPTSPVSYYLLTRYFVEAISSDYQEAFRLCKVMLHANPNKLAVQQLYDDLTVMVTKRKNGLMPRFAVLDTKGKVVTHRDMQSKVNVACLWATWNYESRTQLKTLRQLQKEFPKELSVIGICIDAAPYESRYNLKRDTIDFPIICDGKMWQTPLAKTCGMIDVPSNVVVNDKGIIIDRDIPVKQLKVEITKLLRPQDEAKKKDVKSVKK